VKIRTERVKQDKVKNDSDLGSLLLSLSFQFFFYFFF
jgi:hypothetical protein